ncbi:MAG TPA: hypothetical protein VK934_06430 [Fimbriimonas sp.]|nr:hypothetical protein [Fimbriimonas sp.]
MRIRNKEMRQRRHRKEQAIKASVRDAKANAPEKKAGAAPKPAPKPAAPKKAAASKPAAEKKAAAPRAKKVAETTEPSE